MTDIKNFYATGRLTADATLVTRQIGGKDTPICNFTVAVNRDTQEKNEKGFPVQKTMWVQVGLFREYATKLAPYLKKGRQVIISGDNFEPDFWTGKDKMSHPYIKVTNPTVQLMGEKPAAETGEGIPAVTEAPAEDENELPFN